MDFPILLVEDDQIDVKTAKRAFKANGIIREPYVANNGEEALDFLKKTGKFSEIEAPKPSLIFLDINMPVMNGREFLKAIKTDNELKKIPVIVLTTSKDKSDTDDCFALGAAAYIVKPIDFDEFVKAIDIVSKYWSLSEQPV